MTLSPHSPTKAHITRLIHNAPLAETTKRKYTAAITKYLDTGASLADADALTEHAQSLTESGRAFLKAAIRLWGEEVTNQAKAGATPENVAAVQATVYRIEALNGIIKVKQSKGSKAHTWLTQSEVKRLLGTCNLATVQGKRDRLILGLLTGAGLRRDELTGLTFDDVIIQPVLGQVRTVLNVRGKGAKDRIVPINDRLAGALAEWRGMLEGGLVARSVSKGGAIGESISAVGIFHIVRAAGEAIDKPDLAPHDLRRTYAQLGFEAGVPITQISTLLGHANVATTQRYLNLDLDLETTVSDFIPF